MDTSHGVALVDMPPWRTTNQAPIADRFIANEQETLRTLTTEYFRRGAAIPADDQSLNTPSEVGTVISNVGTDDPALREENYRLVRARENDHTTEHGVICYESRNVEYTRCVSGFNTLKNTIALFTLSGADGGLVKVHASIEEFYNFVVHTSGQGMLDWGGSLNLAISGHLAVILGHTAVYA